MGQRVLDILHCHPFCSLSHRWCVDLYFPTSASLLLPMIMFSHLFALSDILALGSSIAFKDMLNRLEKKTGLMSYLVAEKLDICLMSLG